MGGVAPLPFKSTETSAGSLHEGLGCGLTELLTGSSGKPPTGEESKLAWSPGLLSTGDATCVEARGEPGMRESGDGRSARRSAPTTIRAEK
jgi:hypothetical protein